jgi:hypothetical protein
MPAGYAIFSGSGKVDEQRTRLLRWEQNRRSFRIKHLRPIPKPEQE